MFINANGFKVRVSEVSYETDGKEVTKGHANVTLYQPGLGWFSLGHVDATVRVREGDVYDEKTGKKLVFNVLQRKALKRFERKVGIYLKSVTSEVFEVAEILLKLGNINGEMEKEFKSISE